MSIYGFILLIAAIFLIVGGAPRWPYSQNWGWGMPSFGAVLLVIFGLLVYTGHLHLNVN